MQSQGRFCTGKGTTDELQVFQAALTVNADIKYLVGSIIRPYVVVLATVRKALPRLLMLAASDAKTALHSCPL